MGHTRGVGGVAKINTNYGVREGEGAGNGELCSPSSVSAVPGRDTLCQSTGDNVSCDSERAHVCSSSILSQSEEVTEKVKAASVQLKATELMGPERLLNAFSTSVHLQNMNIFTESMTI